MEQIMTTITTPKAKPATVKKVAIKKPSAAVKKSAPAVSKAKPQQAAKKDKPKKIKMVRDSFSMTESDYANLLGLKKKCIAAGVHAKKSELLRVGLMGLMKLSNASLLAAVKQVVVSKKPKSVKI
jgi:DNA-binding transcriptional regulator YiaG